MCAARQSDACPRCNIDIASRYTATDEQRGGVRSAACGAARIPAGKPGEGRRKSRSEKARFRRRDFWMPSWRTPVIPFPHQQAHGVCLWYLPCSPGGVKGWNTPCRGSGAEAPDVAPCWVVEAPNVPLRWKRQSVGCGLKHSAARNPKKMAAAMPPAVAARPPVKAPMKPDSCTP